MCVCYSKIIYENYRHWLKNSLYGKYSRYYFDRSYIPRYRYLYSFGPQTIPIYMRNELDFKIHLIFSLRMLFFSLFIILLHKVGNLKSNLCQYAYKQTFWRIIHQKKNVFQLKNLSYYSNILWKYVARWKNIRNSYHNTVITL